MDVPAATNKPSLSVVVLCYRAGEEIRAVVREIMMLLDARAIPYELVLVGNYRKEDAGADPTPRIVREIAKNDPRIVALAEEKQGMFGWDVKKGLAAATGEHILFIDGDGSLPFSTIIDVYDALKTQSADMAMTYRVTRHDGAKRILISRIYNLLLRTLFHRVTIYDANAKPKVFTRSALSRLVLLSDDWFIDAEIAIQACYRGFKIAQVPTIYRKVGYRSSFVNMGAVARFFFDLIAYRMRQNAPWRV